ncbi:MAG TPA: hypothetical protein VFM88_02850 [Vicinamibacteria bacterium]|nr:hypothetical protein [Vicinamibacteria bacterium]
MRLALLVSLVLAAAPEHFSLSARYEPPARAGGIGSIAVIFTGTDPDIHINETPAPRLKLGDQAVLLDKQAPAPERVQPFDPATARYLDLALPVYFPVAIAKGAPRGAQTVPATVTYFYCSKRQGWCRKGTTDVAVAVDVR